MIKNKKILVTGGAGFLGSHLCQRLIDLGHQVTALDNLYTGRLINIQPLFSHKNFTFIKHDIIDPIASAPSDNAPIASTSSDKAPIASAQIDRTPNASASIDGAPIANALIDGAIDEIFNLACPASPPHYQKDPIFTTKTNVLGTLNMLELAKKNNARILQASTSEVYGDPEMHPQPEAYRGNVNPIGIRSCYDEGKRCAESLFFDYHRMHHLEIKVVRIFNTYGPNMDPADGRVISNFIMQALHNEPITIYGDGTQTRSFCYVDDLIDGIIALMKSPDDIQGPINLGNPDEYNLLELAQRIIELTNSKSTLVFKPLPQDDPYKRKPDITYAQNILLWKPKIDLITGLKKTIIYFEAIVNQNNRLQPYLKQALHT